MNAQRLMITVFALCAAIGLFECWRESYAAYLEERGTLESTQKALRIAPDFADLYRNLAFLQEGGTTSLLQRALDRNPQDTRSRLQLGFIKESEGDYASAERELLEANRRDKEFATYWSLCNFYFRRNNDEKFWEWVRQAAAVTSGELGPLIGLASQRDPDPAHLLPLFPATCDARSQLLRSLAEGSSTLELLPIARELAGCRGERNQGALLDYVDGALFHGAPGVADEIWKTMEERKTLPFKLASETGNYLTNGDFGHPISRRGFDWHFDGVKGVSLFLTPQRAEIDIEMDGKQPEATPLLWQPVVLESGRTYDLAFSTDSPDQLSGFRWRLGSLKDGTALIEDSPEITELPGARSGRSKWRFRVLQQPPAALILLYSRPAGHANYRGAVFLRNVEITRV